MDEPTERDDLFRLMRTILRSRVLLGTLDSEAQRVFWGIYERHKASLDPQPTPLPVSDDNDCG